MEQWRVVNTPGGPLTYVLVKKHIKNLNLKVGKDGTVSLSIPYGCSVRQADELVQNKYSWIAKALAQRQMPCPELPPEPSRAICQQLLAEALARVYPLVEPLGVAMPMLKLRKMRSQWGNCHWSQGYITLNIALARCPEQLRDYVALHELVHFIHHDHGAGFYGVMDALMPSWRERRKELRHYVQALDRPEYEQNES